MSSSASEVVSTTTGIRRSSSSALIRASTSRPSIRGRLRSRRISPGRGASAYWPSRKRNASASSPLLTTWSSLAILASASASLVMSTSPGSSSTRRISTGAGSAARGSSDTELSFFCFGFGFGIVGTGDLVELVDQLRRRGGLVGRDGDGQGPADGRPLLDGRVEPDVAAVELDDLLAQGQADAGAGIRLLGVEPLEDHEDPVGVRRFDPDPVVGDPERPLPVGLFGADLDPGRGIAAELDGVPDDVLEQGGQE